MFKNPLSSFLMLLTIPLLATLGLAACTANTDTSIAASTAPTQPSTQVPTIALPTSRTTPSAATEPNPKVTATSTAAVNQRPNSIPPAASEAGESWTAPIDQMQMVFVPGDEFRMGTLADYSAGQPDEEPQRLVELASFWIDKTEVTWEMYAQCESTGGCRVHSPNRPEWAESDHPVVMVSWHDAVAYCEWAGRRLPSEAEWEMAARGTEGRRYPWEWIGAPESRGEIRLNYCDASCPFPFASPGLDDGYSHTAPVGSYPTGASPYGALDMAGNVWEWTADWYQAERYSDRSLDLAQGPNEGTVRVIRGGSWLETALNGLVLTSRSANRHWSEPLVGRPDLGFRCALSAQATGSD